MKSDSIWATVLGITKMFGITPQQALYDISYTNAILYSKAMPTFSAEKKDRQEDQLPYDESKDACNTNNFNITKEEFIR